MLLYIYNRITTIRPLFLVSFSCALQQCLNPPRSPKIRLSCCKGPYWKGRDHLIPPEVSLLCRGKMSWVALCVARWHLAKDHWVRADVEEVPGQSLQKHGQNIKKSLWVICSGPVYCCIFEIPEMRDRHTINCISKVFLPAGRTQGSFFGKVFAAVILKSA